MTLDQLKSEFFHWRANKTKGEYQIPQHLWDKVFLLETQGHSINKLCRELSISGTQMMKQRSKRAQEKSIDFIEISQKSSNTNILLENNRCDINLNFDTKTININMTMNDLEQLMPKFKGLFQ